MQDLTPAIEPGTDDAVAIAACTVAAVFDT